MDLTTLLGAVVLALGLIGADTVRHAGSIVAEVTPAPPINGEVVDHETLENAFDSQLFEIAHVKSVLEPPEIRASEDQGLGMEIAEAVNMKKVAYSLQTAFGYAPDRLRLALYLEHGELRGEITATTHNVGSFDQVLIPYKDEPLLTFVHRCALWSASQIAPYVTALYLMQKHSSDKDFTDVLALIDHAKAQLPPTPISYDRGALDNLLGIILLFKNDAAGAQAAFDRAIEEYPANPVSEINAAFADLQLDKNEQAHDRMKHFIADHPPTNKVLQATAYMTWAAAEMGMHRLDEADSLLATATQIAPDMSSSYDLWAELKDEQGDHEAAERYRHQALLNSATFENYAEVATLYFHLSWKDNEPVTLSKFVNPGVVSFH
jgi:tetratricopeptide (TPR) repeat protein